MTQQAGTPQGIAWPEWLLVAALALAGAFLFTRGLVERPAFTDAYYHFNAAQRLVTGHGFSEPYLWTYIGQPTPQSIPALEVPSHLYWMPFTAVMAAAGLRIFGGGYFAAQFPFTLAFAALIVLGYWLGWKLGGTRRHALVSAALTLFSGFFINYWGSIDTFAPYGFFGALALAAAGLGLQARTGWRWLLLAGIAAGIGHLTRADGLLLLLVIALVALWRRTAWRGVAALLAGYLVVMLPWFVRMISVTGSPLPVGGLQAAWFSEYDDLFRFPPDASMAEFFADGLDAFFQTRYEAFIGDDASGTLFTFLAVEGLVVMTPLMLAGAWARRGVFSAPFILYALGLHAAMTLVFPYPGYRGGLFHSAAALVPWWAAFGVTGLDVFVDWIARRRRHWKALTAKRIFSAALVLLAVTLTFSVARGVRGTIQPYAYLQAILPADARVLVNDPAQLYYYTGYGGAVLPNAHPDSITEIARRYGVTHVLLEGLREEQGEVIQAAVPHRLRPIFAEPPAFLRPVPLPPERERSTRLYEIDITTTHHTN